MEASPALQPSDTPIETRIVAARADAERAVALEVADLVRSRAGEGMRTVLGLATGATQRGFYAELVQLHREGGLSFASVVTFNLDEFLGVGRDHPGSFARYMDEALFDHVDLPADQAHLLDGDTDDPDRACTAFEARIRAAGGIDLQLLGLGMNGHIAFNEPGSPRASRTRPVALAGETRRRAAPFFGNENAVPSHALTMGVATILEARRIRMLAFGAGKRDIVRRMRTEPVSLSLPATLLSGHPDLVLWLDREAAGRIGDVQAGDTQ